MNIKRYINTIILIGIIIVYVLAVLPPTLSGAFNLASYAVPPLLVFGVAWFSFQSFFKLRNALYLIAHLLFSAPFILNTFSYNTDRYSGQKTENAITVMSLNSKLFRIPYTYNAFSPEMISWAEEDTAEIKCFQEFSYNEKWQGIDVKGKIESKGYYSYCRAYDVPWGDHNPGLAIFSKFKIVKTGEIIFDHTTVNNVIWADLCLSNDTIRIYNAHLYSMNLPRTKINEAGFWGTVRYFLSKLKLGGIKRSEEIDLLLENLKTCPYPYIVCGDFNEIPYGYNYFKLKNAGINAFEDKGHGFGFTYNGKTLSFLRIDHQFFQDLHLLDYEVDYSMQLSDHFPSRAIYKLREGK